MFVLVHQFLDRESDVDKAPDHGWEEPEGVSDDMGLVRDENNQARDDKTPCQHHGSYRLFGVFALNERIGEEQAGRAGHADRDGVGDVHQRAEERVSKRPDGEKSGDVGGGHQHAMEEQKTAEQLGCQEFAPTVVLGPVSEQQGDDAKNGVDHSGDGAERLEVCRHALRFDDKWPV